ncbi:MAG: hypothetical protein KDC15_00685 [Chitinophagaceae bacterium]|nr:hypothetical protein [Chitinophagaceae bacterium]
MKKKYAATLLLVTIIEMVQACPVCEKQQPTITRGITHGAGPQSNWDWLIVTVISIITLATLFYSVKFLVKPGEKNSNHIKNSILNFN